MSDMKDSSQIQQAAGVVAAPVAGLRRLFPWIASVLVIAAIGLVTYRMDADTAVGHASGMPYLWLTLLYVAIFAAQRRIYRSG